MSETGSGTFVPEFEAWFTSRDYTQKKPPSSSPAVTVGFTGSETKVIHSEKHDGSVEHSDLTTANWLRMFRDPRVRSMISHERGVCDIVRKVA